MKRCICALGCFILSACAEEAPTGIDWVSLPGGCFQMGNEHGYPEERPAHEACVDSFSISRTEITNAQFTAFVDATGHVTSAEQPNDALKLRAGSAVFDPRPNDAEPGWWRYVEGANWRLPYGPGGGSAKPDAPVVHVTQDDAAAFAKWAGGRLPTEAEWEFAAQKSGAESDGGAPNANTWDGMFPTLNTQEDGFEGVAPVASFPPNRFGLHDMVGNVWELTNSPYAPSHAVNDRQISGPNGLDFNQPGIPVAVIKGGSYLCAENYCARFRPAARQAQDLKISTSHIGFRVVKSTGG